MASLGDVAEINPKLDRSLLGDQRELVSFVPMASVSEQLGQVTSEEARPVSDVLKGFTSFQDRDVLVAKITPCFENGKIAHARICRRLGFGSTEFHVVRPKDEGLDDRYLYHFLRQPNVRMEGERRMTGSAGQKRVPKAFLESLDIPLPSLAEQRRIAAILDKADALRAKRREAIAKLDQLLQSAFLEMFGDPYTSERWPRELLGQISSTSSGGTPDRSVAEYFGGDIPWVKSGEVARGEVMQTEEAITSAGLENSSAKLVPADTVLLAMYGATAGAVAMLKINAATNQAICAIRAGERLNPVFLLHLLMALAPSLIAKAVGGAQPNLSQTLIRNLRVPLPPRELQDRFAHFADRIGVVRRTLDTAAEKGDLLFTSLQERAFAAGV